VVVPEPPANPTPGRPPAPRSSRTQPSLPQPSMAQLDSRLRPYCRSLTKSARDGEDLAQDTWLKALKADGVDQHLNREALLVWIAKTVNSTACGAGPSSSGRRP